jgi:hypothetical protein
MLNIWLLVAALLVPVHVYLLLRASAYRVDRPDSNGGFGVPYFWNSKYLHKKNFRPEGHKWLSRLHLCTVIFWAFAIIGLLKMS